MSRKSLIICLALVAGMILGVGAAVAILYSDGGGKQTRSGNTVPDQERYLLLPAVPADAVVVACFSDAGNAVGGPLSGIAFPDSLATGFRSMKSLASARMTASLHFSGKLHALYVFDAGKASAEPSEDAAALLDLAIRMGMKAVFVDGSAYSEGDRDIYRRSLVVVSDSETLLKSSIRHLQQSVSIMQATGFDDAAAAVSGNDLVFFSNSHAKMLMAEMFTKKYAAHNTFVSSFAQWTVANITKSDNSGTYLTASAVYEKDDSDFMSVLAKSQPAVSKVAEVLPSYTVSAVSLPMKNHESYISAYQSYMDSKQSLQSFRKKSRDLQTRAGISPEDFVKRLDIKEVARATFASGSKLDTVNLIRIGRQDTLIFVGVQNKSFKDYTPAVHSWPYASFASAAFGKFFELRDESCFTYINGWIVSGSLDAVDEYVQGRALEYNLVEYMADSGQKDMLSTESVLVSYFSFTENPDGQGNIFRKPLQKIVNRFHEGCDYCPAVMSVGKGKNGMTINLQMPRLSLVKTKAPEFERNATVEVPEGPFRVKNSGTGKMNLFYQNSHGALCLKEEDGKGLWGIPFDGKLCGTAQNVDYYANGKLQIIFGSGSKIYVIDRLGRFVTGFPVDLGKEILIGPDVYDFNGTRAYNIMVLHKDNTIEMYNLKGNKPSSWKSIIAPETIKALPERIKVGDTSYWVVRTSIQTLIYPFNGGSALTEFKGDQMIRPDSIVRILDGGTSVSVDCYDGKSRTVKLK